MSCELRDIRRELQPQQFAYDALTARLDKTQWKRTAGVLLIEIRRPADIARVPGPTSRSACVRTAARTAVPDSARDLHCTGISAST
jgi:hypothetical protein